MGWLFIIHSKDANHTLTEENLSCFFEIMILELVKVLLFVHLEHLMMHLMNILILSTIIMLFLGSVFS